jgi:hypothetical protein
MSRTAIAGLICCLLVIAICVPSYALAGQGVSNGTGTPKSAGTTIVKQNGPAACNLIDFEGVGDYGVIGVIPGAVTVTFGASWLGIVDYDAGGNGNIANEPSPNTTAFYLDQNDLNISLSPSVQYLEFFYSAAAQSLPVIVTAYDAGNNVVDSEVGNVIGTDYDGANCTGDPNGNYCTWGVITLTAAADNIAYVTIAGTVSNYFTIDNLQFCTEEQELGACCLPDGSCAQLSQENCRASRGTWYAGRTCDEVDCPTVPTKSSTWGGIKALYRTP